MQLIEITTSGGGVALIPASSLGVIERIDAHRWRIDYDNGAERTVCSEEPCFIETFPAEPGVLMLSPWVSEDETCWEWTSSRVLAWRCWIGVASGATVNVTPVVDEQQFDLKNQVLVDTKARRARLACDEVWGKDLPAVLARSVGAKRLELLPGCEDVWSGAETDSIRSRRMSHPGGTPD